MLQSVRIHAAIRSTHSRQHKMRRGDSNGRAFGPRGQRRQRQLDLSHLRRIQQLRIDESSTFQKGSLNIITTINDTMVIANLKIKGATIRRAAIHKEQQRRDADSHGDDIRQPRHHKNGYR